VRHNRADISKRGEKEQLKGRLIQNQNKRGRYRKKHAKFKFRLGGVISGPRVQNTKRKRKVWAGGGCPKKRVLLILGRNHEPEIIKRAAFLFKDVKGRVN